MIHYIMCVFIYLLKIYIHNTTYYINSIYKLICVSIYLLKKYTYTLLLIIRRVLNFDSTIELNQIT